MGPVPYLTKIGSRIRGNCTGENGAPPHSAAPVGRQLPRGLVFVDVFCLYSFLNTHLRTNRQSLSSFSLSVSVDPSSKRIV